MINEIGRSVMQGGSRRSAIYASLNWKHGDIQDFLNAKNWQDMPSVTLAIHYLMQSKTILIFPHHWT